MLQTSRDRLKKLAWLQKRTTEPLTYTQMIMFIFFHDVFKLLEGDMSDFSDLSSSTIGITYNSLEQDLLENREELYEIIKNNENVAIDSEINAKRARFVISSMTDRGLFACIRSLDLWRQAVKKQLVGLIDISSLSYNDILLLEQIKMSVPSKELGITSFENKYYASTNSEQERVDDNLLKSFDYNENLINATYKSEGKKELVLAK